MPRQRETRRLESLQVVTTFAAILIRGACELALVNVLMAVLALCLRDLKYSIFVFRAGGDRAFLACHGRVRALERIFRGRVILHGENRRLESLDGMAGCAFAAIRA